MEILVGLQSDERPGRPHDEDVPLEGQSSDRRIGRRWTTDQEGDSCRFGRNKPRTILQRLHCPSLGAFPTRAVVGRDSKRFGLRTTALSLSAIARAVYGEDVVDRLPWIIKSTLAEEAGSFRKRTTRRKKSPSLYERRVDWFGPYSRNELIDFTIRTWVGSHWLATQLLSHLLPLGELGVLPSHEWAAALDGLPENLQFPVIHCVESIRSGELSSAHFPLASVSPLGQKALALCDVFLSAASETRDAGSAAEG